MRPTIKSVAAAAGVSTATVSYVLSGRANRAMGTGVSTITAQKVHDAAASLDYRPNQAARTMRTGKSNLMILSLTMLSDPWALAVIKAVGAAVEPAGITPMILADTDWRTAIRCQSSDVIFIDAADRDGDAELLAKLAEVNKLVVFSDVLEPNGFDVVRSTAGDTFHQAMDHLTAGHGKVAALAPADSVANPSSVRYAAYLEGLQRAGIDFRRDYVATFDRDATGAYEATVALLQQPDPPTAIFATTDFAAIAAVNAAQRMRLKVPEDVAVIGVGNTPQGEVMSPSLSTIGPVDFFDKLAAFLMTRATDLSTPPQILEFPWQLHLRESAPGSASRDFEFQEQKDVAL